MKYWLNFYSDTFVSRKNGACLLYNCANSAKLHFFENELQRRILDQLEDPDNLYSIEIDDKTIELIGEQWFSSIEQKGLGQLVAHHTSNKKPVSFFPLLNLQKDIERLRKEPGRSVGESLTSYLTQISAFIGGENAPNSNEYYKQVLYPINTDQWLSLDTAEKFINNLMGTGISTINIIGNLFGHPDFEKLLNLFCRTKAVTSLYIHYADFIKNRAEEKVLIDAGFKLKLICKNNENIEKTPHSNVFYVCSEAEYDRVTDTVSLLNLENYEILPVWNGENEVFFQNNVYLTEEELMSINISKREVFALQVLNTNHFGKLVLLPDGKVYSNINDDALGNVDDSIYQMLYREMDKKNNWCITRYDLQPCSDCVYCLLCPSPSNYESVIGKNNLCTVKK